MTNERRDPREVTRLLLLEADPEMSGYLADCLADLSSPAVQIQVASSLACVHPTPGAGYDLVISGAPRGPVDIAEILGWRAGARQDFSVLIIAGAIHSTGWPRRLPRHLTLLPEPVSCGRLQKAVSAALAERQAHRSRRRDSASNESTRGPAGPTIDSIQQGDKT